ncbi:hypothetical protein COF68_05890 [Bacillus toyonensis]|uniref:hypothetical protein n=1 Tax=Bacillus toyonensis TaxID=155322 RepID=UPI000BFB52EA|nr:hypothetical protein [Bacillus toyonensis]PHE64368.1 hypothetical protein COF68_05890 [Bacillus toyonensis]
MINTGKKVLKLALLSGTVIGMSGVNPVSAEDNKINLEQLYKTYNSERNNMLSIQKIAEKYELNAIYMATKVKQWNMFGHNSEDGTEDVNVNPVGKFEDKNDLFKKMGEDLNTHKEAYDKYVANQSKPMEEQEEMQLPTNLDYLSVSEIKINYFYDSNRDQLSQVIRIESPSQVYRCTVLYDHDGLIINYLEV